jgi:hypothetical protein
MEGWRRIKTDRKLSAREQWIVSPANSIKGMQESLSKTGHVESWQKI